MTSVPYPSFVDQLPVDPSSGRAALSAVGRCRIFPESCTSCCISSGASSGAELAGVMTASSSVVEDDGADEYLAIVAKNVLQAQVDESCTELDFGASNNNDSIEKIKKRYMKESVAMAKRYLSETLLLDTSIVDVELVVRAEDLLETQGCLASCLLDAGCQAIVTDGTNLEAMDVCQIPRERLVAHFTLPFVTTTTTTATTIPGSGSGLIEAIQAASSFASCVSVELTKGKAFSIDTMNQIIHFALNQNHSTTTSTTTDGNDDDDDHHYNNNNSNNKVQVVLQFRPQDCIDMTDEELGSLVAVVCRKLKNNVGTVTLVDPTSRQLGLAYAACLTTDRKDTLYTTVVCTRNGEALGLVYSSPESIVAALESGRGVYYSRSRKGLWRKGDTSGHYQTLHRIDVDCDGDALRFTVTQRGGEDECAAFCHLNTLTCWGAPKGLRHLEETLQQRLRDDAPAGSYTKRLFNDTELLRNKLVEEAQELAEAETPEDVASELADVLYFAMVRAAKAGVSIDDAVQELDQRARKVTRRQGDSKAFRIEAGEAILQQQQQQQAKNESI